MPRDPKHTKNLNALNFSQDRQYHHQGLNASRSSQHSHSLDSSSFKHKPHRRHSIEASNFNPYHFQRSITILLFSGRNQRWHSASPTATLPEIPLKYRHPEEDRIEITKALLTYTWKDASLPKKRKSAANHEDVDPLAMVLSALPIARRPKNTTIVNRPRPENLVPVRYWGSSLTITHSTVEQHQCLLRGIGVASGIVHDYARKHSLNTCLDMNAISHLALEDRQARHDIAIPQVNIRSVRCPVVELHSDLDKEDAHSNNPDTNPDEGQSIEDLIEDEDPWSDLAEDPPWPDGEAMEFSANEHVCSNNLVTKLDTEVRVLREKFSSSSNEGCSQSTYRPQTLCHKSDNSDTSSESEYSSDSDSNSSSGSNSSTESAITAPESEPDHNIINSPPPFQLNNTIHAKFIRWQQSVSSNYALVHALADWLSHDNSISHHLLDIGPCLPSSATMNICGGTTSSCPICLYTCIEYYPQWSFLLPILEESTSRIENGKFWVWRLSEMLRNDAGWRQLNSSPGDYEDVEFWTHSIDLNSIPEPPAQQLVTPDLEAKISEAEERLKKKQRRAQGTTGESR